MSRDWQRMRREMLREKMLGYMDAGVDVEVRSLSAELSGGNLLPGFKLSLSEYLWVVGILILLKRECIKMVR
ncbi:MAG: hypothetical protein WBA39_00095 [Rivularia sp. (in: cyanobacteria)]